MDGSTDMKGARSLTKSLANWAISLILALAALEVGARLYVTHFAGPEQFSRYASLRQHQARGAPDGEVETAQTFDVYLPFVNRPDYSKPPNRHNALGFRGEEIVQPKPAGEFRIACLGASTTYTSSVRDFRFSYPSVLERQLRNRGVPNTSVINAGANGWTSYETLINFAFRVLDLDPDLIVVKHAFSDVAARVVWPPEAYRGDNSGLWAPRLHPIELPPVYEESALVRMLLVEAGLIRPHSLRGVSRPRADSNHFLLFGEQRVQGIYPSGIFARASVADMLAANPPIYFRRNLENLLALARYRNIGVVLLTYPYSTSVEDSPWTSEEFLAGLEEHNEIVRSIGQEMDVPVLDLAALLPTDEGYFGEDGFHMSRRGARRKAQLVADFLIEQRLVPGEDAGR